MKTLLAIALAGAMGLAHAGTLGIHMVSDHPGRSDLNGINPGLYYRADNGITVGGYYNSIHRASVYLGHTSSWVGGHIQLTVGGITGYDHKVMPMAVPSIKVWDNFRIAFVPRFSKVAQTFHVSYELGL